MHEDVKASRDENYGSPRRTLQELLGACSGKRTVKFVLNYLGGQRTLYTLCHYKVLCACVCVCARARFFLYPCTTFTPGQQPEEGTVSDLL